MEKDGTTCEICDEGEVGYLDRSPAKLENDNEEWVIQHLLVCTHSEEEKWYYSIICSSLFYSLLYCWNEYERECSKHTKRSK